MPTSAARRTLLAISLLVGLVGVLYGLSAQRLFIDFDTFQYLTGNPRVLSGVSWSNFAWAFTAFDAANWHPLTWISHQIDVEMFGVSRTAHHLANAAWHAANSVLLFVLLQRWTASFGRSLFVAALFAAHPLHVESVAWIVERKDLLSTFFGLASLHAWTSWARARSRSGYVLALVCFALSLMAKPMLVTLPCVLLLLDAWPLARTEIGWRARIVEKLPFLVLAIASSWITLVAQRAGGAVQGFDTLPLAARFGNAVVAYATYLRKTVWPVDLAVFYPLSANALPIATILAALVVLAALTYVAAIALKRSPAVLVGWLFFLGTLVPVIGLVQVGGQALADRYTYVPLVGLFVALAWAIPDRVAAQRSTWIAGAACVLAASLLTWKQIGYWKDTRTLSEHAIAVTDDNFRARAMLGHLYVEAGDLDRGLEHLYAALRIAPTDADSLADLGIALLGKGRVGEAEQHLREAVDLSPNRERFLTYLARLLVQTGRPRESLEMADRAIAAAPEQSGPHYARARALEWLGKRDEARAELARTVQLAPRDLFARVDLARMLIDDGKLDEAWAHLQQALAIDARNAQALQQRARISSARGEISAAILDLRAALSARADWTLAQIDLAWLLATSGDASLRNSKEAVRLAEAAVGAGNDQRAPYLDVLAAAYAADRRFLEAVAVGDRATELARATKDSALADRIAKRVAAYRKGEQALDVPR